MGREANESMGTWGNGELGNSRTTWEKGGMGTWGQRFWAQPFWHRQETTQESSCAHAHTQKVAFKILGLMDTAA